MTVGAAVANAPAVETAGAATEAGVDAGMGAVIGAESCGGGGFQRNRDRR